MSACQAMPAADTLTLRDATPSDHPFLLALYSETRADEFAQFGWPPETERAFMQLQFEARCSDYERRFPGARNRIVELQRRAVGRLWTAPAAASLQVLDIAIVAELRGQGLGTECLRGVQRQAAAAGRAVELQVVAGNPAQRLYERLGFRSVGESGVRRAMVWRPLPLPADHFEEMHHDEQA